MVRLLLLLSFYLGNQLFIYESNTGNKGTQ